MLGDARERLGYPSAHDQCVRVSVRLWREGLAPPADTLGTKRSLAGTFHPQEAGGTACRLGCFASFRCSLSRCWRGRRWGALAPRRLPCLHRHCLRRQLQPLLLWLRRPQRRPRHPRLRRLLLPPPPLPQRLLLLLRLLLPLPRHRHRRQRLHPIQRRLRPLTDITSATGESLMQSKTAQVTVYTGLSSMMDTQLAWLSVARKITG